MAVHHQQSHSEQRLVLKVYTLSFSLCRAFFWNANRNKKRYGSYRWLIKKVVLFTTFLVILNLCRSTVIYTIELEDTREWYGDLAQYKLWLDLSVGCIVYVPALLVMLCIICYLPAFDDYLLIREEAKFSVWVFILLTAMNAITSALHEQSDPDKDVQFFDDIGTDSLVL